MSVTIHEVLGELRASALDERDKGDKFERLVQSFLRTDPEWTAKFDDVWTWTEWPERGTPHRHRHRPGRQGARDRHLRCDPVQVLRRAPHRREGGHRLLPLRLVQGRVQRPLHLRHRQGLVEERRRDAGGPDGPGAAGRHRLPRGRRDRLVRLLLVDPRGAAHHRPQDAAAAPVAGAGRRTPGARHCRPRQADHGLRYRQDLHVTADRGGPGRRGRLGAVPGADHPADVPEPAGVDGQPGGRHPSVRGVLRRPGRSQDHRRCRPLDRRPDRARDHRRSHAWPPG